MESKLKQQCMDSVGGLPAGYLHLPTTPIKQEPELTDWISGDLKPVRDGVYQRLYGEGWFVYCRFSNGAWYEARNSIEHADLERSKSTFTNDPWRGLAKNPEVQP